jgi:uncharacterized protein with von Willebrand factor type A (vWA) domain
MNAEALTTLEDRQLADFLQTRLVEFVRLARSNNFRVGVAEELDAQNVALKCGLGNSTRLRWGLRALLCSDQDDWQRFDELYDAFWLPANVKSRYSSSTGGLAKKQADTGSPAEPSEQETVRRGGADSQSADEESDAVDGSGTREGASFAASLAKTDFQALTDPDEMRAVEALVDRLARQMRKRAIRRQRVSKTGKTIHLRKTLRGSLRFGGTPLVLSYKERIKRQPRLVLIVDVSRSMSMYSFFFLRFARALVSVFRDVSVFAYHTQLLPITEALRQTDLIRVRNSLAMLSQGWSGGTRIGESLATFNDKYGQILNSRSIAVIVSDGLDTGDPDYLATQLARIKPRCRKLVWLNPLLGRNGYEPVSQGMQAALPYLDLFAPAHNLNSLQALEPALTKL